MVYRYKFLKLIEYFHYIVYSPQVVGRWKSLARRLGFSRYIPDLEIGRRNHRSSHRNRGGERQKLQVFN